MIVSLIVVQVFTVDGLGGGVLVVSSTSDPTAELLCQGHMLCQCDRPSNKDEGGDGSTDTMMPITPKKNAKYPVAIPASLVFLAISCLLVVRRCVSLSVWAR